MKQICWLALTGLLVSLGAVAQDNAARDGVRKEVNAQVEKMIVEAKAIGPDNMLLTAPVTGAPYSADEVTTFTDALADGTLIRQEDKVTVYRDSQGRLRRETPTQITISDPVAGVAYTLDPNKLTARKMTVMRRGGVTCFDSPGVAGGCGKLGSTVSGGAADAGPSTFVFVNGGTKSVINVTPANRQSLGTQSFDGVLSEGTSTTTVIPAGSIGNDRDIQVVDERWYSSELKTVTMTKHSDPRSGEVVFRLTNIHRGEPSPDLFQLSAGYRIAGEDLRIVTRPAKQD